MQNDDLGVDARFLLANERTLLAWIRTALAVLAGGIALIQISDKDSTPSVIGTTVVLLGAFMAIIGYVRFRAADIAIHRGEWPSVGRVPFIQAGGVIVVALALVTTHLAGIW